MRWQQSTQKAISEFISIARMPLGPKMGLRVLSYHSVGGSALRDTHNLNTISIDLFKQHIDFLAQYSVINLNQPHSNNNEMSIGITFDDGYKDNLYQAAPILIERNLPFTIFIATQLVEKSAPGFLTPSELLNLANLPNVSIGAHSKSHIDLTSCSDEKLRLELYDSKSYLEDLLGIEINSMSYPFGKYDKRVRDYAENVGFKIAYTSEFGINQSIGDALLQRRTAMLNNESIRVLKQKAHGDWDWYNLYQRRCDL